MINDNLLLENYSEFFAQNAEYTQNPAKAVELITENVEYDAYTSALLEGYDEDVVKAVKPLFDRQREVLLESSNVMLGTPNAIAYATASFPLILDIFSDDMLSKGITIAPTSTPTKTVTKLKWTGTVTELDGSTKKYNMPSGKDLVRPGFSNLVLTNTTNNIFTQVGITDTEDYRIVMRNFRLASANIKVDGTATEVKLASTVDARGNFSAEGTLVVDADNSCDYKISGQVNPDTGEITHAFNVLKVEGSKTYELQDVTVRVRIFGEGTGKSTVVAKPNASAIDFICDVTEDVEIPMTSEYMQDWNSVYKIDVLANLKKVVKQQFALNKNFDIVDVIEGALVDIQKYGAYKTLDLNTINANVNGANITDFYKSIIPAIVSLNETIKTNNGQRGNVLIASTSVAVLLKSLQETNVGFDAAEKFGTVGASSVLSDFNRFTILSSPAVTDDRLIILSKGVAESEASVLELSYQPLYIVSETTNGKEKLFIKSRNDIQVIKPEAIGILDIKNIASWLPLV